MNKNYLLLPLLLTKAASAGIVADTLYLECRGESKLGQRAVATVIFNRAKERNLSLEQVCLQPKQFSCWNSGYKKPLPTKDKDVLAMRSLEQLEKEMKSGTFQPLGSWNHYHTVNTNPSWSKKMYSVRVIGKHKFGRINK